MLCPTGPHIVVLTNTLGAASQPSLSTTSTSFGHSLPQSTNTFLPHPSEHIPAKLTSRSGRHAGLPLSSLSWRCRYAPSLAPSTNACVQHTHTPAHTCTRMTAATTLLQTKGTLVHCTHTHMLTEFLFLPPFHIPYCLHHPRSRTQTHILLGYINTQTQD